MICLPDTMKVSMLKIPEVWIKINLIHILSSRRLFIFNLYQLQIHISDTNISIPPGGSEITAEDTGVVDSSSIIIIHPGSRYLRIGRASDTSPKKVLHAVARKRTKAAMKVIHFRNVFLRGIYDKCKNKVRDFLFINVMNLRILHCNEKTILLSPK